MNNKQRHISCCDACENDAVHHTCEACMQIDRDHVTELEARIKELEEKLSLAERNSILAHERTQVAFKEGKSYGEKLPQFEWRDIPDDHLFPTGRYLIEIVDEDGPLVHLMEVEQTFTAIGGCLSFDMPGKRTRYMTLPTPPSTQEGEE